VRRQSVIDGVKFISGAVNYKGDPIEILQKLLIKENACAFELYCSFITRRK
jgi:NADP-dependent alcohol dehydrogenase